MYNAKQVFKKQKWTRSRRWAKNHGLRVLKVEEKWWNVAKKPATLAFAERIYLRKRKKKKQIKTKSSIDVYTLNIYIVYVL